MARALPGCLIHTVAAETQCKEDMSYFVVEAWVDRLEDVPTEAMMDIHEPKPCVDPLCHAGLSPCSISTECCLPEHLRICPPRALSTTVLVHLDSSTYIRPAPAARNRWNNRDDYEFGDGDDETTLTEEQVHPWAHGIPDDVWHQRLEAASSGSAAGQHRPRRRSGGRARTLTPANFHLAPLEAPPRPSTAIAASVPTVHAVPNPNGAAHTVTVGAQASMLQVHALTTNGQDAVIQSPMPLVNTAAPTLQPVLSPSPVGQLISFSDPVADKVEAMPIAISGSEVQETLSQPGTPTAPHTLLSSPAAAVAQVDMTVPAAADVGDCSSPLHRRAPASPRTTVGPIQSGQDEQDDQSTPVDRAAELVTSGQRGDAIEFAGPLMGQAAGDAQISVQETGEMEGPQVSCGLQAIEAQHGEHRTSQAVSAFDVLDSMLTPIRPPLIPGAPPRRRYTRSKHTPGTATRRSHRIENRKLAYTGSGNRTLKQARRVIISKRGLALAEKGDDSDDEVLRRYNQVFIDGPLSPERMVVLGALAKGAKGKARKKANAAV